MFRIWYEDGFIDGETFQDWINAPEDGVITIYQLFGYNENNIKLANICSGSDWYWMNTDGKIDQNGYSGDEIGVWVDVDIPNGAVAKKGKWVSLERLSEVEQQLLEMMEN